MRLTAFLSKFTIYPRLTHNSVCDDQQPRNLLSRYVEVDGMYSVVLMAALTAGSSSTGHWFSHGCSGCYGCYGGCHGCSGWGYTTYGGNLCHGCHGYPGCYGGPGYNNSFSVYT